MQQTFNSYLQELRKHASILENVSANRDPFAQLSPSTKMQLESQRLIQNKKINKRIRKKYFNGNGVNKCVWRCLICNTFNQYNKQYKYCLSCIQLQ